jgi:peroxiredoxin
MITIGAKLPPVRLKKVTSTQVDTIDTTSYFAGKTTLLFGLPGAFTPVCSNEQVPSYVRNKESLKAKGVDQIACLAVNDFFVMQAWSKDLKAGEVIDFLADGSAEFTKALGLDLDLSDFGMGLRCSRFAMIVKDGMILSLNLEESAGTCGVSHGDQVLKTL